MEGVPHLDGDPDNCPGCYEQYAPCPFCEDGRNLEFSAVGVEIWGPEGYWQGRIPQPKEIDESCRCYETRSKSEYATAKVAELRQKVQAYLADQRSGKTTVPRTGSIAALTSTSGVAPASVAEPVIDETDTLL